MYGISFTLRILLALLFGLAIGAERQWRHKVADLRTNALVAVGASLYVTLSVLTLDDASPTRVAAQVVSGIGFLGAGVIIREGVNIRGINTAATLWCSAAIGVLTGTGFYFEAFIGTAVILLANIVIRSFQYKMDQEQLKNLDSVCRLDLICNSSDEAQIRQTLNQNLSERNYNLLSISSKSLENKKEQLLAEFSVPGESQEELEKIMRELKEQKEIHSSKWKIFPAGHGTGINKGF